MRILIIADYLPFPLIGGDRIRTYNLLLRVAAQHEVYLAGFLEESEGFESVSHLEQFCSRVETARLQRRSPLAHLPGLVRYTLAGKPLELKFLYSQELYDKIRRLFSEVDFDIVQIESRMGLYWETIPQNLSPKSIMMFQNFTFQQYRRVFHIEKRWDKKVRSLLNSVTMLRWESHYPERFDRCTTVSETDKQLLLKRNPRLRVDVIPNGVDIQKYQPLPRKPDPSSFMFIGNMGYPPCVDAALYFCKEILPIIRKTNRQGECWIVGRDPDRKILALNRDGVHVTGRVDDVVPYYQQSDICVVPLRAGGGTRLKILESMALGRPVVSTTIGCEGLDVMDGEHLLIADSPEQFAEKSVKLLNDPILYQRISTNARHLVETRYDWDTIASKLMSVYTELVGQRQSATRAVGG
jgi:sugar transferase (PEP-CTERM/EpsH1 system associated)